MNTGMEIPSAGYVNPYQELPPPYSPPYSHCGNVSLREGKKYTPESEVTSMDITQVKGRKLSKTDEENCARKMPSQWDFDSSKGEYLPYAEISPPAYEDVVNPGRRIPEPPAYDVPSALPPSYDEIDNESEREKRLDRKNKALIGEVARLQKELKSLEKLKGRETEVSGLRSAKERPEGQLGDKEKAEKGYKSQIDRIKNELKAQKAELAIVRKQERKACRKDKRSGTRASQQQQPLAHRQKHHRQLEHRLFANSRRLAKATMVSKKETVQTPVLKRRKGKGVARKMAKSVDSQQRKPLLRKKYKMAAQYKPESDYRFVKVSFNKQPIAEAMTSLCLISALTAMMTVTISALTLDFS